MQRRGRLQESELSLVRKESTFSAFANYLRILPQDKDCCDDDPGAFKSVEKTPNGNPAISNRR